MDTGYITLAALGGATVGGVTSFVTSWTTQSAQMRAERRASNKIRRQKLYKVEEVVLSHSFSPLELFSWTLPHWILALDEALEHHRNAPNAAPIPIDTGLAPDLIAFQSLVGVRPVEPSCAASLSMVP